MNEEMNDLQRHDAMNRFVKTYNVLAAQASRAENEGNSAAADLHIQLSGLTSYFVKKWGHVLTEPDAQFLRSETVARCMQALLLRSMALSGFGDLALSLSATRRLNDDIATARKRIEENRDERNNNGGGDEDDNVDPRIASNGLYEYIPRDKLNVTLSDLPGYESQHRKLMHAYYVLESSSSSSSSSLSSSERSVSGSNERSGANAILYGPPGTGKTAAARAVAASLRLDFVFVNTENILSAYRSETEKNLRALYRKMRLLVKVTGRNVVLLLDEVDGLVKNRRGKNGISNGDYSLLTKFLTILEPNDGSDNYGIFSIFTTNNLSNLDDAFRRRCVTIFFGPVTDRIATLKLFHKFFDDVVESELNDPDEIVTVVSKWVPGDFVRFKRDVLRPLQLRLYLLRKHLTTDEFYAQYADVMSKNESNVTAAAASASSSSRSITLDLPLLKYREMESDVTKYRPITVTKYRPIYSITSDYAIYRDDETTN